MRTGEVLGMIGPNGAGKSTADRPDRRRARAYRGRLYAFRGATLARLSPHQRAQLGDRTHVPGDTALRRLDYARQCHRWRALWRTCAQPKSSGACGPMRCSNVWGYRQGALKGDELTVADRKRLEMARALATQARCSCLDEVMSGLTLPRSELRSTHSRDQ